MRLSRRRFLMAVSCSALSAWAGERLPQSLTFVGKKTFDHITARGIAEGWSKLTLADRLSRTGLAMQGTPYVGFTLEIDDHIESPSVNFNGLDCWTFFETALCLARLFRKPVITPYENAQPSDLLREIERTRYRGGQCGGNYLDRIHYLEEWLSKRQR